MSWHQDNFFVLGIVVFAKVVHRKRPHASMYCACVAHSSICCGSRTPSICTFFSSCVLQETFFVDLHEARYAVYLFRSVSVDEVPFSQVIWQSTCDVVRIQWRVPFVQCVQLPLPSVQLSLAHQMPKFSLHGAAVWCWLLSTLAIQCRVHARLGLQYQMSKFLLAVAITTAVDMRLVQIRMKARVLTPLGFPSMKAFCLKCMTMQ